MANSFTVTGSSVISARPQAQQTAIKVNPKQPYITFAIFTFSFPFPWLSWLEIFPILIHCLSRL
jgi:hypothetical protein